MVEADPRVPIRKYFAAGELNDVAAAVVSAAFDEDGAQTGGARRARGPRRRELDFAARERFTWSAPDPPFSAQSLQGKRCVELNCTVADRRAAARCADQCTDSPHAAPANAMFKTCSRMVTILVRSQGHSAILCWLPAVMDHWTARACAGPFTTSATSDCVRDRD